jgi:hypothetical protein
MTSRSQLVPGRPPPAPLEMVQIAAEAAELLRSTYVRIWTALASGGRLGWTETQWREDVSKPGVSVWVARVDGRVVGLLELEAESHGDVGIVVFGLVPELIGRGFGLRCSRVPPRWPGISLGEATGRGECGYRPPQMITRAPWRTTSGAAFSGSASNVIPRRRMAHQRSSLPQTAQTPPQATAAAAVWTLRVYS